MEDKIRVLIVEDEANIRSLYSELLRKEGYEVTEASDTKTGIAKALESSPNVIFLDVVLPDGSGVETLRNIKSNPALSKVKVMMFTNMGDDAAVIEAMALGAEGYLIKSSLNPSGLVNEVKRLTGNG